MAHAATHTLIRWEGGVCPFDAGWRKVMMWWFIVTDGLVFAGFLAAYGYARLLAIHWPDQASVFSLRYIAAMTFVLITSSVTGASASAARPPPPRRGARSRRGFGTAVGSAGARTSCFTPRQLSHPSHFGRAAGSPKYFSTNCRRHPV